MLTLMWIVTSFWSSWTSVCESSHHLIWGGYIHTPSANKEKEAANAVTFPRTQSIHGRQALRFLIWLWGWNTGPNGLTHSHIQILYRHSYSNCLNPCSKMSIQESDQTQYVNKTLWLCKVQWSRSSAKCIWPVSRWGVWCVCDERIGGQITARKSLWADIQSLFINIGWMTNSWPVIFSLLHSIYFII